MPLPVAAPEHQWWNNGLYVEEPILCWAAKGQYGECDEPAPNDGVHLCARHRAEIIGARD